MDLNNSNLYLEGGTDAGLSLLGVTAEGFRWIYPYPGQQSVVADLNGDALDDLALSASYGGTLVAVLLNDAQGHLGTESDYLVGGSPEGVAVGNMFGRHYDGGAPILDLVSFSETQQRIVVLENDGNGNFTQVGTSGLLSDGGFTTTVTSVAAGDFNGDGVGDVAVLISSTNPNTLQIFLGDGTGNLTAGPTFPTSLGNAIGGMDLLGGPFGRNGAAGFFSIIDDSATALYQDACH